MKGLIAAAALAAAITPAVAGAQPIGSDKACGVGMLQGQGEDSCRFIATSGTLGLAGFVSGSWALTHKEKTSACVGNVIVHTTTTVTDLSGETGPVVEQTALVANTVYTLTLDGDGGIMAGGPSGGAPSPSAEHPADAAVDKTGGTTAGAAC